MNMNRTIFLSLILCFFSATASCSNDFKSNQEKKIMGKIYSEFISEVTNKYSLKCFATKGSVYIHKGMWDKGAGFYIQGPLSKGEIRFLLLELCNTLVNKVNASKNYQKYLTREYAIENTMMSLVIHGLGDEYALPPFLSNCFNHGNSFSYYSYNVESGRFEKEKNESETLEEALTLNEAFIQKVKAGEATCRFME